VVQQLATLLDDAPTRSVLSQTHKRALFLSKSCEMACLYQAVGGVVWSHIGSMMITISASYSALTLLVFM
jgi:hypothetical protein